MSESTSRDARSRHFRRILAIILLLEAALCVVFAVLLVIEPAADRLASLVMALIALLLGGALVIGARAALHGRRAARAPIIVWQLMQLSVAYITRGGSWLPFGIALAVLAGGAVVVAMWPGVLSQEAPAG